ncbi:DUF6493 family protein [Streptomyces sp. NPDC001046]|uniref:DUF7824 domain-containing protein n=1 Tax=Streptomyces sp. NPDC001046 TaxID=3364543 RepID=UPI0036AC1F98
MDDFGRWASRFIEEAGPIGDFARRIAADPDWPVAGSPHDLSFGFYVHQLQNPALGEYYHLLDTAWNAYVRQLVDDTVLPALPAEGEPVAHTHACLLAVLEGGTLEQLVPLLLAVRLEPQQRDELLARADEVTTRLSAGAHRSSRRARRYRRMVAAGLVCHPDPEGAADWVARKSMRHGETDRVVLDIVGRRDAAWREAFARRIAEGDRAAARYRLLSQLNLELGVPVPPTRGVAKGCLSHHASAMEDAPSATGEAILTRLRQDPLAHAVLPLITRGHDIERCDLGQGAARVLAVAIEAGYVDRAALITAVTAVLDHTDDRRPSAVAGRVALLEHLAPTEEEFAPCHEKWVGLLTSVPAMRKPLLVRAVGALAREGRFPARVVDEWIEVVREKDIAHARTAVAGLAALRGDPRYLSDAQVAAVLRIVTTGSGARASATMALLKSFAAAGRLTVDEVARCAREVLFRPDKSSVTSMIVFLGHVLHKDPGCATVLVPLLADAFGHTSPAVQEKALDLAERHAAGLGATQREALAAAVEALIPALRTRARTAFGDEAHPPATEPEGEPALIAPAHERVAAPVDGVPDAVEELAVVLRARVPDPVTCERAMDALVRCAHQDRTGFAAALGPLLKSIGRQFSPSGAGLAEAAKPLMAAMAVAESLDADSPDSVTDEIVAAHTALFPADLEDAFSHQKQQCGHLVFDRVLHARWAEVIQRLRDRETTPLLLATPTWTNGTIAASELVARLTAYDRAQARPGRADLEQALLRVRHDHDAERAATAAEALGTPEALRLAQWLRDGGLTLPETVRTPLEARHPENHWSAGEPWRLRAAVPSFTDRLDGFSEPFRDLAAPYLADEDHCGVWESAGAWPRLMLHWLMVLPGHREILTARTLTAFAEGAEASRRSAAVLLPALADAEGTAGTAVRLALAHGLGAHRAPERVAAGDAFLTLAARRDLDAERFGRDLAELITGQGVLKVSRVVESLTVAAQGGAQHEVALVLAALLGGRLGDGTVTGANLGRLLTLAAECVERSGRPLPPVDGLAEFAGRRGSAAAVRSARRLRDAMTRAGSN